MFSKTLVSNTQHFASSVIWHLPPVSDVENLNGQSMDSQGYFSHETTYNMTDMWAFTIVSHKISQLSVTLATRAEFKLLVLPVHVTLTVP